MKHDFKTKGGRDVLIDISDGDYTATVYTVPEGDRIGALEFRVIERDERSPNTLYLSRAYLDGLGGSFVHQGIGRQCLVLVARESGMQIYASDDDGLGSKEDGSHLTGDAPGFVARMREERVLGGGENPDLDDDFD
ncbi:hypothetical protein [Corallococcus aberystwythensis]|uniref:Uncharacterized protein n=1 Tax=Corallococcus aberystwythensis TaxID=2316722 RepID=A0A3A8Q8A2_9BACT|nr:hypothetical protein [Corallococcus aberystwythensis]RKH63751.1 hypothetical protein D7W81_19815 [Corallococcus aberystwythensis]